MFHIVSLCGLLLACYYRQSSLTLVNFFKRKSVIQPHCLLCYLLILASLAWFGRSFALRAQDRAIRAEENFRHFILTGNRLDGRLRLEQIIALRFAADEEFALLCEQAVDKNLNAVEIKKAIRSWRADHHRA
jgi:hypothetical protein